MKSLSIDQQILYNHCFENNLVSVKMTAINSREQFMSTEQLIQEQLNTHPLLIYMKGTPDIPMCGFSSKAVAILQSYNIPFAHVNILDYPEIRATLPKMMHWPTFPQIYVKGELIGGCDILIELHEAQELKEVLAVVNQ